MKGTIVGSHGKQTGGEFNALPKGINMNARNLRRLAKKYPNDMVIQNAIKEKLKEFQ